MQAWANFQKPSELVHCAASAVDGLLPPLRR
jgi:hypothetical protein